MCFLIYNQGKRFILFKWLTCAVSEKPEFSWYLFTLAFKIIWRFFSLLICGRRSNTRTGNSVADITGQSFQTSGSLYTGRWREIFFRTRHEKLEFPPFHSLERSKSSLSVSKGRSCLVSSAVRIWKLEDFLSLVSSSCFSLSLPISKWN